MGQARHVDDGAAGCRRWRMRWSCEVLVKRLVKVIQAMCKDSCLELMSRFRGIETSVVDSVEPDSALSADGKSYPTP